jgi:hypothetical protein
VSQAFDNAVDRGTFPHWWTRERIMLKITITETPTEQRWVLEGRLAQPWVAALRAQWRQTRRGRQRRTCVVDLNDVRSMDHRGSRSSVRCCVKVCTASPEGSTLPTGSRPCAAPYGGAGMQAMVLTRVVGDRSKDCGPARGMLRETAKR